MDSSEKPRKSIIKRKSIFIEVPEVEQEELCSSIRKFLFLEIVGKGGFGKVYKCMNRNTMDYCAIKIISKNHVKGYQLDKLKLEAYILSNLDHPNIVKFKEVIETYKNLYIVMELVEGGNLKYFIQNRVKINLLFNDEEASQIMKGILNGIEHIHLKNIIHRDIKPLNILLNHKNEIKIADFGLSTEFAKNYSKMLSNKCGTVLYMAPEFVKEQTYCKPVDIWACAIIMYEILSNGNHPIYKKNMTRDEFTQKLMDPVWEFPASFSNLAQNFFLKISATQQSERYSASQALMHPWITRNMFDPIPFSYSESNSLFNKAQLFIMSLQLKIASKNEGSSNLNQIIQKRSITLANSNKDEEQKLSILSEYLNSNLKDSSSPKIKQKTGYHIVRKPTTHPKINSIHLKNPDVNLEEIKTYSPNTKHLKNNELLIPPLSLKQTLKLDLNEKKNSLDLVVSQNKNVKQVINDKSSSLSPKKMEKSISSNKMYSPNVKEKKPSHLEFNFNAENRIMPKIFSKTSIEKKIFNFETKEKEKGNSINRSFHLPEIIKKK